MFINQKVRIRPDVAFGIANLEPLIDEVGKIVKIKGSGLNANVWVDFGDNEKPKMFKSFELLFNQWG